MNRQQQQQELTIRLLTQAALSFAALLFYILVIAAMSGCSNPYEALYPSPTATTTASPSATATINPVQKVEQGTPTPRPACTVSTNVPLGYLNLRSGPGTDYAVIGLLHEGETLTVIRRGAWLEVETTDHLAGWVNGRYCK